MGGIQVDAVPALTKREKEVQRKRRLVEEIREWRPTDPHHHPLAEGRGRDGYLSTEGPYRGTSGISPGDVKQGSTHCGLRRRSSPLRDSSSKRLLPASAMYTYSPFDSTMSADLVALIAVASAYTAASPARVSTVIAAPPAHVNAVIAAPPLT